MPVDSPTNDGSSFCLILDNLRTLETAIPGEKCREVHGALTAICEGPNADSFGFEIFQGSRNVQKALAP